MHPKDLENKIEHSFFDPRLEYEVKQDLFHSLDSLADTDHSFDGMSHIYDTVMARITVATRADRRTKRIRLLRTIASRAAVFILGLISAALLWYLWLKPVDQTSQLTVIAAPNAVTETILPDGTRIFLNAKSKISYLLNRLHNEREVTLEGEAWFDVAKNQDIPFTVKTSVYKVRVHGTAFNIRSFDDKSPTVTTLQHGSIEILPLDDSPHAIRPVLLIPGQQYYFDPLTKEVHISKVNSQLASIWKESEIRFENKKFKDLLKILEGRYHVRFEVKDPTLFDYHYDGTIRNESLTSVLDILRLTLPFHYHITDDGTVIIKK